MAATPNPVEDDFYDTTDDHLFASINVDEDGTSQSNLHVSQSTITDEHDQEQQGENELEEEQIQLVADNPECSSKPSEKSIEMLRKYFGFSKFRPLQYEIIETALRGRDQLCVMSTGYGKSICYQMPALVNDSLTLVVSPLISLMEDQVNALTVAGIESAYLGGNGTFSRDVILKSIEQNRLRILYITPEMYEYNSEFVERIKKFVCLLAVDEAHCISQWGHEFRPGYRFIAKMRASLPGVPVMALTATATEPVRNDICQNLNMKNPKITTTGFDRKNLYIEVKMRTSSLTFEHSVQNDIERLLIDDPKHGPNFGGSTIIYCQSRENVDRITRQLRSIGVKCVGYHAAMNGQAREKAHKDFLTEKANTCVATIAFGMGIDKKDVRKVIHYGSPGSIENYYQEIGRAGRDGFNSQCIIFYSNSDLMMNRSRILKRPVNGYNKPNDYEQHQLDMLRRMEQFLTTTSCRRYLILSYFDNSIKHPDVPQSDCCDNCTRLLQSGNDLTGYGTSATAIDFGIEAGQLFEVIGQIYRGYSGLNKPVDFIRGNSSLLNDKSTLRGCKNPKNHPLFGIGKGRSEMWWKELGKLLRNNGYLVERKETFQQYGCTIKLSDKAERWIEGRTKQLKLIPSVFLENANRESPSTNVKAAKGARVKKPIFDIVTERLLNAGKQREYKDASNYPELAAVSNANIAIYEILPELRKQLEDLRYELALEMDCAANSIYSNTVIENLLKIRPTKQSTFENVEGIPQQRQQLLSRRICPMIEKFCNEKKIPRDCSNCTDLELPEMIERLKSELSETERRYYINHVLYKLTLQEVANRLKATTSTVGNHLATAVKRGLPLDLDVLGITLEMIEKVYGKVEENRRDIFRLKPIMEMLPADTLDYNQMKIIFSIFEYEYGFVNSEGNENAAANCEEEVASIFKRKVPAWIQTSATVPNSEDNAGPLIKKKCHSIFQ